MYDSTNFNKLVKDFNKKCVTNSGNGVFSKIWLYELWFQFWLIFLTFMGLRNMILNWAWPSFLQTKEVWFRFDAKCNDHVPKFNNWQDQVRSCSYKLFSTNLHTLHSNMLFLLRRMNKWSRFPSFFFLNTIFWWENMVRGV